MSGGFGGGPGDGMAHVLAIDQGTSSSRAVVFDAQGRAIGAAQRALDASYPKPGRVEQDPEAIWQTTLAAGRGAIADAGVDARRIDAIGIANQRETTLLWEAEGGRSVCPAIVWQDRRTAEHCRRILADGMEAEIRATTGLVVDPYFSATKLARMLEAGDIRRRAEANELRFGTVDTFLISRLTGGRSHVTDATNASRTMLYDLERHAWSETLVDYLDIPRPLLPRLADTVDNFGVAEPEWFGAAIPIRAVAGDQQAALAGQGCVHAGEAKCTFGTGCFLLAHTGTAPVHATTRLLTTVASRFAGTSAYALEGSVFNAGVAVKWLRDRLGLIASAAETEAAARRIGGDTDGVVVVPAFTGLGAPHWDPDARGLVTGLTLDTGADQVIAATLKGVAFQVADLLAAMATEGVAIHDLHVDGGMVANDWFCEFLADITAHDVQRPADIETTVAGAGRLALVGAGLIPSLLATPEATPTRQSFAPRADARQRQAWLDEWQAAIRKAVA